MGKHKELEPEERRNYLARLGSNASRGCPTATTAQEVWNLLAEPLGIKLNGATIVQKQALVVVLDTVIAAGRHATGDLFHRVFDALASRWSLSFIEAEERGAFTVYNMTEQTVKASYRELGIAEVTLYDLWRETVTKWVKRDGENPLYDTRRVPFGTYQVILGDDAPLRDAFLKIVCSDAQYRPTPRGHRLLLDKDPAPGREPQREVAAEWSFNEVLLGEKSQKLLAAQEQTRLLLNVNRFRADCQDIAKEANAVASELWEEYAIDASLDHNCRERDGKMIWSARHKAVFNAIPKEDDDSHKALRRPVWVRLAEYDRLRSMIDNFDEVYARTSVTPWGHAPEPGVEDSILFDCLVIKSGFHRDINRRYDPAHFWPTHVPKEYRSRWFRVQTAVPTLAVGNPLFKVLARDLFDQSYRLVDRDISSSQTQILAVLLNIPLLEKHARSTTPKFKHYLANEALRLHRESGDNLLADGYQGEDGYEKLVAFVKELWMRTLYGSAAREVVFNLAMEVKEYGFGWKTKAGLWEDDWLVEAEHKAQRFLASFPWYADVERYLHVCQHLGDRALAQSRFCGVEFTDPYDKATVRWNPVQRARKRVPVGSGYLYPSLPGKLVRRVFQPAVQDLATGDYAVDPGDLKRGIAPMSVHMLDAYFSSLVIEGLLNRGVRDVVGIHDNWHVPAHFVAEEGGPLVSGERALADAIKDAGPEWLQGLGSFYREFIAYLGDTEDGRWFQQLEGGWRARVARQDWPVFTAV